MYQLSRRSPWGALGGVLALLALLIAAPAAFAQTVGTISGQVSDAEIDGPLPGVNVRLEGLTIGTTTDADGVFSFSAPAGDYTIVFSFTGYSTIRQPITVRATTGTDLNVEMSPDALRLDDVVVTGYSNRERRNLATSISSIDGAELQDIPVASVDNALQGRSAGVTVLRSSGTPGGGVAVRVRGGTSINGSNEPLYVVDGVPVASGNFSGFGVGNQGTNALSTLDTQDIESIEVLKDAAATAIYGTRAANGVVLITTRRGRSGQTRINLETSVGASSIPGNYEVLTGAEYRALRNEGVRNQGFDRTLPDRFFGPGATFPGTRALPFGDPNDPTLASSNFYDEIRQTGLLQTYRLSLDGGNQTTRFLVSGNYLDEEGALVSAGFQRYNGRVNVDHTPNARAIVQASASYNRGIITRIENDNNIFGVLTNALISNPGVRTRTPAGELTPAGQFAFDNPVSATEVDQVSVDTKFLGNVTASYEFVPGLRVQGSAGLDRLDLRDDGFSPSFTRQGAPAGSAFSSVTTNQRYILQGSVGYRQLLNEVHDVSALIGSSAEKNDFERTFASSSQFATDLLLRVSEGASVDAAGSSGTRNSLLSFFGNTDYSYDGRYLATFNARLDGSSRFGDNNRFAFFPGLALGWNVTEESFMEGFDTVSQLKLRGSIGRTGQQEIGNFASLGLFGFNDYAGVPAGIPTQLANPDLKWETTTQISGGIDFGLFRSRLTGVFDVYAKYTDDLLLGRILPSTTGFNAITSNIGSVRNTGVELQLTTLNVRTQNVTWETTLNVSRNVNEVTALFEDSPFSSGFASRVAVGRPVGSFFGYQTNGLILDPSQLCTDATGRTCIANGTAYQQSGTRVGDVRFVDIGRDCLPSDNCAPGQTFVAELDGRITAADRTFIGDANPDLFGGFTNRVSAFGFEVSAFLQFSLGNDVYNNVRGFNERGGGSFGTSAALRNRVQFNPDGTVANPDATLPRATFNDPNQNARDSDLFVEDGSYVRLKTLTLGYNVPSQYLGSFPVRSLRVFGLAENLFTITDYSGLDPEVSTFDGSNTAFGTDFFTYPQAQRFVLGVRLGL